MKTIRYCLIPALLLSSQAALADGPRWRVTETSGDVQVMRSGLSRTATRGSMLYSGDIVATGDRGRAVVTRGEEYMIVSPGTRLRLPGDTRAGGITRIIEEVGNVVYNVQRRNHEHFGVETPYLAAVVKGTTFSVTVGPEGSSVQVLEGLVEVSTLDGGATQLVEPGSVALVAAGNRYQLTVEGNGTEVIDSPNAPENGGEAEPGDDQGHVTTALLTPSDSPYADQIVDEIRANPVELGALTGGIVGGANDIRAEFSEADYASLDAGNLGNDLVDGSGASVGGGNGVGGGVNVGVGGGNGVGGGVSVGVGIGDGNNGHGNDPGGFDSSNPGNSLGVGGGASVGGGNGVNVGVGGGASVGGGNGVNVGVGGGASVGGGNGVNVGVGGGASVGGGNGVNVGVGGGASVGGGNGVNVGVGGGASVGGGSGVDVGVGAGVGGGGVDVGVGVGVGGGGVDVGVGVGGGGVGIGIGGLNVNLNAGSGSGSSGGGLGGLLNRNR
ncbi:FecR family protein [Parasphingopyxis marina]|uniref:FecR domain-containing protein n=1 Tax=Parasphingopyxis marina TaxID=2761622 RepID=A0A842HV15_9SPHN|nr:FecR family protein [Parasphingopyxis marina]MBC2777838.1 FecR domain-containing protein [Parasphingopyxis marina]